VHQKGVDLAIDRDRLDYMRRAAMAQAFSWTQSAKSYAAIYKSSI
jgi:starch synthase